MKKEIDVGKGLKEAKTDMKIRDVKGDRDMKRSDGEGIRGV